MPERVGWQCQEFVWLFAAQFAHAVPPCAVAELSGSTARRFSDGIPLAMYQAAMHVLREGGKYLLRRERRLWWYFASASATMILLGFAVALRQPLALVAIPIAFVLANAAASRLGRVRRGRVGEKLVTDLLRRLPDDYYLVNDVVVEGSGGNIDHVVLGPCGVVVIETKRLAGMIRCDGDEWYVNGRRRGSISRQVNRGAVVLRHFLAERHPDVNSGYVESIAVFTHPLCRLKVNRARTTVVRYSELRQLLLELGRRHRMPAAVARRLAESLAPNREGLRDSGRPVQPKDRRSGLDPGTW